MVSLRLPLSDMEPALSAACDLTDHMLWELDDILWDPFSLVASPLMPPGVPGQAAAVGSYTAPAAPPVLLPPLATSRRPGGCKKPGGCLVSGCSSRELTPYERRAMLCSAHLSAPSVTIAGAALRFCQKCRRLEPVSDFDGEKRSCRARLQAVRAKRASGRGKVSTASLEYTTPPPPQTRGEPVQPAPKGIPTAAGWTHPPRMESQAVRSLLSDPVSPSSPGSTDSEPGPVHTPETSLYPPLQPPPAGAPSWLLPLPECLSVELKLGAAPQHALLATAQEGARRQHLLSVLSLDMCAPELEGVGGGVDGSQAAHQLFGAITPGCTLLTLDACLDGSAGTPTLLRPGCSLLLDDPPAWVARMASQHSGGVLRHLQAARVRSPTVSGTASVSHAPVAVLSTSPGETLVVHGDSGTGPGTSTQPRRWTVRLNGQYLQGVQASEAGEHATRLELPPSGCDGCAWVASTDGVATGTDGHPGSGDVAVLLLCSTTPEVVTEVNATLAGSALKPRDGEALTRALWAVGNALALRESHVAAATPPAAAMLLAFHGAAAALRFGWAASLEESLQLLACAHADAAAGTAPPRGARTGASLMHQAAMRGCPLLAGQLLDVRCPEATGTAVDADASGLTPLHIAAAAGHGRLLARLCVQEEGPDEGEVQAAALCTVTMFTALSRSGCTPAQLAQRHEHLRPLVAQLRRRVARGAAVLRGEPPSDPADDAVAAALVTCLQQAEMAEAAERLPEQATSLLVLAGLHIGMCSLCLSSRRVHGMLGKEAAMQALLDSAWRPSWPTWLRIPSAMCASPHTMPGLWTARLLFCCAAVLVGLVAYMCQGRTRGRQGRTRGRQGRTWRWAARLSSVVTAAHFLLLFHVLLLDPAWLTIATYSHFGGAGLLRRPWPGAVVQWVTTGACHLASNGLYRQQNAYAAFLLARGVMPLLARVVGLEAAPDWLRWVAWAKIVDLDARCDLINAAVALLAVAHARWTQRRRQRRLAQMPK